MLEDAASPLVAVPDSIGSTQLRILRAAYVISSLGSAVSTGAIPLIAVERLGASAGAISAMAACAAVATWDSARWSMRCRDSLAASDRAVAGLVVPAMGCCLGRVA